MSGRALVRALIVPCPVSAPMLRGKDDSKQLFSSCFLEKSDVEWCERCVDPIDSYEAITDVEFIRRTADPSTLCYCRQVRRLKEKFDTARDFLPATQVSLIEEFWKKFSDLFEVKRVDTVTTESLSSYDQVVRHVVSEIKGIGAKIIKAHCGDEQEDNPLEVYKAEAFMKDFYETVMLGSLIRLSAGVVRVAYRSGTADPSMLKATLSCLAAVVHLLATLKNSTSCDFILSHTEEFIKQLLDGFLEVATVVLRKSVCSNDQEGSTSKTLMTQRLWVAFWIGISDFLNTHQSLLLPILEGDEKCSVAVNLEQVGMVICVRTVCQSLVLGESEELSRLLSIMVEVRREKVIRTLNEAGKLSERKFKCPLKSYLVSLEKSYMDCYPLGLIGWDCYVKLVVLDGNIQMLADECRPYARDRRIIQIARPLLSGGLICDTNSTFPVSWIIDELASNMNGGLVSGGPWVDFYRFEFISAAGKHLKQLSDHLSWNVIRNLIQWTCRYTSGPLYSAVRRALKVFVRRELESKTIDIFEARLKLEYREMLQGLTPKMLFTLFNVAYDILDDKVAVCRTFFPWFIDVASDIDNNDSAFSVSRDIAKRWGREVSVFELVPDHKLEVLPTDILMALEQPVAHWNAIKRDPEGLSKLSILGRLRHLCKSGYVLLVDDGGSFKLSFTGEEGIVISEGEALTYLSGTHQCEWIDILLIKMVPRRVNWVLANIYDFRTPEARQMVIGTIRNCAKTAERSLRCRWAEDIFDLIESRSPPSVFTRSFDTDMKDFREAFDQFLTKNGNAMNENSLGEFLREDSKSVLALNRPEDEDDFCDDDILGFYAEILVLIHSDVALIATETKRRRSAFRLLMEWLDSPWANLRASAYLLIRSLAKQERDNELVIQLTALPLVAPFSGNEEEVDNTDTLSELSKNMTAVTDYRAASLNQVQVLCSRANLFMECLIQDNSLGGESMMKKFAVLTGYPKKCHGLKEVFEALEFRCNKYFSKITELSSDILHKADSNNYRIAKGSRSLIQLRHDVVMLSAMGRFLVLIQGSDISLSLSTEAVKTRKGWFPEALLHSLRDHCRCRRQETVRVLRVFALRALEAVLRMFSVLPEDDFKGTLAAEDVQVDCRGHILMDGDQRKSFMVWVAMCELIIVSGQASTTATILEGQAPDGIAADLGRGTHGPGSGGLGKYAHCLNDKKRTPGKLTEAVSPLRGGGPFATEWTLVVLGLIALRSRHPSLMDKLDSAVEQIIHATVLSKAQWRMAARILMHWVSKTMMGESSNASWGIGGAAHWRVPPRGFNEFWVCGDEKEMPLNTSMPLDPPVGKTPFVPPLRKSLPLTSYCTSFARGLIKSDPVEAPAMINMIIDKLCDDLEVPLETLLAASETPDAPKRQPLWRQVTSIIGGTLSSFSNKQLIHTPMLRSSSSNLNGISRAASAQLFTFRKRLSSTSSNRNEASQASASQLFSFHEDSRCFTKKDFPNWTKWRSSCGPILKEKETEIIRSLDWLRHISRDLVIFKLLEKRQTARFFLIALAYSMSDNWKIKTSGASLFEAMKRRYGGKDYQRTVRNQSFHDQRSRSLMTRHTSDCLRDARLSRCIHRVFVDAAASQRRLVKGMAECGEDSSVFQERQTAVIAALLLCQMSHPDNIDPELKLDIHRLLDSMCRYTRRFAAQVVGNEVHVTLLQLEAQADRVAVITSIGVEALRASMAKRLNLTDGRLLVLSEVLGRSEVRKLFGTTDASVDQLILDSISHSMQGVRNELLGIRDLQTFMREQMFRIVDDILTPPEKRAKIEMIHI